jgi:hypothetical protein
VMSLLLITTIPESLRLLLARNPADRRIPKILAKLAPDVDARAVYARKQEVQRQSATELLNPTYRKGTLMLWFVFFFNMFILYLLVTWLPTLLTAQGWSSRMLVALSGFRIYKRNVRIKKSVKAPFSFLRGSHGCPFCWISQLRRISRHDCQLHGLISGILYGQSGRSLNWVRMTASWSCSV